MTDFNRMRERLTGDRGIRQQRLQNYMGAKQQALGNYMTARQQGYQLFLSHAECSSLSIGGPRSFTCFNWSCQSSAWRCVRAVRYSCFVLQSSPAYLIRKVRMGL